MGLHVRYFCAEVLILALASPLALTLRSQSLCQTPAAKTVHAQVKHKMMFLFVICIDVQIHGAGRTDLAQAPVMQAASFECRFFLDAHNWSRFTCILCRITGCDE
jgi:hypothetical protein